jgi:hypothetical protein
MRIFLEKLIRLVGQEVFVFYEIVTFIVLFKEQTRRACVNIW